jgi:hypothetical protein
MSADGPEDREYERCEHHDAEMLKVELSEKLADEMERDMKAALAQARVWNHFFDRLMTPRAADCDVCGQRPGTHTKIVCQTDTWVCDECAGRE